MVPLPKFPTIKRSETLADKVCTYLEKAIIEGKIPAGTKLTQTELAERFGVSRPPVREAIQRLQATGLIKIVSHKWVVVTLPDRKKVKEIYSAKKLIEGFAVREAAGKISSEEAAQLNSLIQKMEVYAKTEEGDKYIRIAEKFHDLINRVSGNAVIYEIYKRLSKQTLWHRINFLSFSGRLERSFNEHKRILDVLMQEDKDLAESLMREHIEYSKKTLLQRLDKNVEEKSREGEKI